MSDYCIVPPCQVSIYYETLKSCMNEEIHHSEHHIDFPLCLTIVTTKHKTVAAVITFQSCKILSEHPLRPVAPNLRVAASKGHKINLRGNMMIKQTRKQNISFTKNYI